MHRYIPLLLLLLALVESEILRNHPPRDRVKEALAVLEESLLGELRVDDEDGTVGRAAVLHPALAADPVGGLFGVEAGLEGEEVPAELQQGTNVSDERSSTASRKHTRATLPGLVLAKSSNAP